MCWLQFFECCVKHRLILYFVLWNLFGEYMNGLSENSCNVIGPSLGWGQILVSHEEPRAYCGRNILPPPLPAPGATPNAQATRVKEGPLSVILVSTELKRPVERQSPMAVRLGYWMEVVLWQCCHLESPLGRGWPNYAWREIHQTLSVSKHAWRG